jgi:hypothetical protein
MIASFTDEQYALLQRIAGNPALIGRLFFLPHAER